MGKVLEKLEMSFARFHLTKNNCKKLFKVEISTIQTTKACKFHDIPEEQFTSNVQNDEEA